MPEDKSIKSSWIQFWIAQAIVMAIYSAGLAFWLGGYTNKVENLEKVTVAQEIRINDIDKYGSSAVKLEAQTNAVQERRIQVLEADLNTIKTNTAVIAAEISSINKKLDNLR